MRVEVLGPIQVDSHRGHVTLAGAKARGLLGTLALEPGAPVSQQRLVEMIWGDDTSNGPNVVQVTVSKLRRALAEGGEPDRIRTVAAGYQLDVARSDVDALQFEALVDQARSSQDPEATIDTLDRALELWRGDVIADAPSTLLLDALRVRWEERRLLAMEDRVDAQLLLGRHGRVVGDIEEMVAATPLRERRWGQLMRALYGAGQQVEALRAFQRAREVLIEQMGVEPSPELRQLEAAVLNQDESLLGPPASHASERPTDARSEPVGRDFRRRGNLRHPISACLGRDTDLARLVDLCARHRLVTLVGPGGVGKTRLAQELAGRLVPETDLGVWWVDLAAARDDLDVVASLQRTLQVESTATERVTALAEMIGLFEDRRVVIVLDNCEQLLGSIEEVVVELLEGCAGLCVVCTSRGSLGVPGQALFSVAPLALDAAVTLFRDRAGGTGHGELDPDRSAVEICERVDRLPLAIELAAARARHLGAREVLDRLSDRLDPLGRRRAGPRSRQDDLWAVADWSYQLLAPAEQVVFERLSVFADGATSSAAAAVCSCDDIDAEQVEAALDVLIDRSLVVLDRTGPVARYRLLQTLRDHAADRLAERGTENQTRGAHAEWVRRLAALVAFGVRTDGATVAAVQTEDVAIRDAVSWGIGAHPRLAVEICTDLAPLWQGTMRVPTGWELLGAALDALGDTDRVARSGALAWATVFSTMLHDTDTADRLADEAWADESERGDPERLGRLAYARAIAAGYRSDVDPTPWLVEADRCFVAAGAEIGLGHVRFAEGAALLVKGDPDGARRGLSHAAEIFRREGDHLGLILAVSRLGELAWRRGDADAFADLHAEMVQLGRESESAGVMRGATARLAHARLLQGRFAEAEQLAAEAVAAASGSFMPVVDGFTFMSAGLVNLGLGHVDEARRQLLMAAESFVLGTGHVGTGLAAICWLNLARAHLAAGAADEANLATARAAELATASGDPWVIARVETGPAADD